MTSKVCPRCGRIYTRPPALSRRDNITEICSECGIREALDAMQIRQNATRRAVYSSENRRAVENFKAAHN